MLYNIALIIYIVTLIIVILVTGSQFINLTEIERRLDRINTIDTVAQRNRIRYIRDIKQLVLILQIGAYLSIVIVGVFAFSGIYNNQKNLIYLMTGIFIILFIISIVQMYYMFLFTSITPDNYHPEIRLLRWYLLINTIVLLISILAVMF